MSVLAAFMSTWSGARQTFGEGPPQSGAAYDDSSTLRSLSDGLAAADPGDRWTGSAANAYAKVNTEHRRVISALADLDEKLAAQVDRSAEIVAAGRADLDSVRQWVADAAGLTPPGLLGEQMMLPIALAGIGRVTEIVTRANGDLNQVGAEIAKLGEEYRLLGNQKFGPKEAPPEEPKPDKDDELAGILEKYQVSADPDGTYTMNIPGIGEQKLTASEMKLLARLGPYDAYQVYQIKEQASAEALRRFPTANDDEHDNHTDAFRHAYANALMTEKFGAEWTAAYATAHERLPVNPGPVEAMDLYNNEVGRNIAAANPDAGSEQLADMVEAAVRDGDTVVIAGDGNLGWSDRVPLDQTGSAGDAPSLPGSDPKPLPYP